VGPCYTQQSNRQRITDLATYPAPHLTIPQLAEHLTVAETTVRRWIRAGVLPAYQFQGKYRIRKTDAIVFVERSRVQV
jgi:excisionase family DNA binding protein